MLEKLTDCPDQRIRRLALENIAASAEARATRRALALAPFLAAVPSPEAKKHRLIYDGKNKVALPGTLVRAEGDARSSDPAVNEAYDFSGATYDFYKKLFDRNSLDNRGMSLISTVHHRRSFDNAFWNGEQMVYGDGDGIVFQRFTRAVEVVGHELTHGVVTFTSNLEYQDEPGALNEHFADAMASCSGNGARNNRS
jgi:Zn-dependent metalloprotease